jgi:D-glycero-D-manno-heptose 1,7-bisphosphate phosphatase
MNVPKPEAAFLDGDGVWRQVLGQSRQHRRPALFLDRDGVIVEEVLYLHRVEDVAIIPGAGATIAAANRRGVPVVIVSNQAGIGRGYYGWTEFEDVQRSILDALHGLGARLDAVLACPHHPEGIEPYIHPAHPARKPQPGMLLRAADLLNIDLGASWIVGDKSSDLLAGRAAGLRGGVLVTTGHGVEHRDVALALATPEFQVLIASSIREASGLIPLLA